MGNCCINTFRKAKNKTISCVLSKNANLVGEVKEIKEKLMAEILGGGGYAECVLAALPDKSAFLNNTEIKEKLIEKLKLGEGYTAFENNPELLEINPDFNAAFAEAIGNLKKNACDFLANHTELLNNEQIWNYFLNHLEKYMEYTINILKRHPVLMRKDQVIDSISKALKHLQDNYQAKNFVHLIEINPDVLKNKIVKDAFDTRRYR